MGTLNLRHPGHFCLYKVIIHTFIIHIQLLSKVSSLYIKLSVIECMKEGNY